MKLESKSTRTYRYQNRGGELIHSFLKACIVLNGLNKSLLHSESIELQIKWAISEHSTCRRYVNYIARKPRK